MSSTRKTRKTTVAAGRKPRGRGRPTRKDRPKKTTLYLGAETKNALFDAATQLRYSISIVADEVLRTLLPQWVEQRRAAEPEPVKRAA